MVQTFITFIPVKNQFQEPTILITEICSFWLQILIGFQDNDAEDFFLLYIALLGKSTFLLSVCQIRDLLGSCFFSIFKCVQITSALDLLLPIYVKFPNFGTNNRLESLF